MITGKNYLGEELSGTGKKSYATFDPVRNAATTWEFYEATDREIDMSAEKAERAFAEYAALPGTRRAAFLREIAEEMEALGPGLVETYCLESGLPEGRALGEKGRTMGQLRAFADLLEEGSWVEATIDTAQQEREPVPKADIRKMLWPIGPIAVFGSSNFPLAFSTAGGDTASALAAGCPVVVKSHPMHAGTGELVASAIIAAAQKTGMPDGVFSNLNSSGIQVGQKLVLHPKIKAVGFTGSVKGGTAVYRLAARRPEPIPVFAEMGSINPVVLLPKSLHKRYGQWAKEYAGSITLGAGQFCTNPGLLVGIKGQGMDNFIVALAREIEKLDSSCMLHPSIHENYERGKRQVFIQEGTRTVLGSLGEGLPPNHAGPMVMTVDAVEFIKNPVLREEVFGPFSLVVQCDDSVELLKVLGTLEGQLSGTLLGEVEELEHYGEVVAQLKEKVGRLVFNGVPTGTEVCPSMQHGGPFPASSDSRFTAVGASAIRRWLRPVSYQNWPQNLLPDELKDENPRGIVRLINGKYTSKSI